MEALSRGWSRAPSVNPVLATMVVAMLAYAVILFSAGGPAGKRGDPSVFIHAGQEYLAPDLLPSGSFIETGTGFDGQFIFYFAQDPLLTGKAAHRDEVRSAHVDNVAYRYQRILLPVLGWLTSWGDPDILQWTLPLLNLLSVLGATWLIARHLDRRGRPAWWALAFALSVGVTVGVVWDLSDPIAVALFAAGVVWWLERRTALAIVALAGCLLARELYLLPVAAIAVAELLRDRRRGLVWLVPLGVLAAWQVLLRLTLAASPTEGTHRPSVVPLLGAARKVREVLRLDALGAANWEVACVVFLLAACALLLVRAVLVTLDAVRARRAPGRDEALVVIALASVVLVPFLSQDLWRNPLSYTRYAAPLAAMVVILAAVRPDRWLVGAMAAIAALSVTNPVVAMVPAARGGAIVPPQADPNLARSQALTRCLTSTGLTARRREDSPSPTTTKLTVTLRSGASITALIFASDA